MTDTLVLLRIAQDDDVLFHRATRVELLVAHLHRNSQLVVAAGCYHPAVCYAHRLVVKGRSVVAEHVPSMASNVSSLVPATLVQNAFVARVQTLREHPWDERQQLMEHETFFASLATAGHLVGFDPSVTLLHSKADRSYEYFLARHREALFLQFTCRNFPRVDVWEMPFFTLNCGSRSVTFAHDRKKAVSIDWDATDDSSTSVYHPGETDLFIVIPSSGKLSYLHARDRLRASWLAEFKAAAGLWPAPSLSWDHGFFIGNDSKSRATAIMPTLARGRGVMLGDIVCVDAADDYQHLGRKVLASLRWVTENVQAKYILCVMAGYHNN